MSEFVPSAGWEYRPDLCKVYGCAWNLTTNKCDRCGRGRFMELGIKWLVGRFLEGHMLSFQERNAITTYIEELEGLKARINGLHTDIIRKNAEVERLRTQLETEQQVTTGLSETVYEQAEELKAAKTLLEASQYNVFVLSVAGIKLGVKGD